MYLELGQPSRITTADDMVEACLLLRIVAESVYKIRGDVIKVLMWGMRVMRASFAGKAISQN